jgi:uncharacterized protein
MYSLQHHLWIGFAGGLLAFAHCLGMCGAFVLYLSQEQDRKKMLAGQLLWQGGKFFTYTFLGALAGYAGNFFQLVFINHAGFRQGLTWVAGGIILLSGLSLLGLLPVSGKSASRAGGFFSSLCGTLGAGSAGARPLLLGMMTGFLPCPIIVAFLAYSLQTGSVAAGMTTMAGLSVGTMLPLMFLGGITGVALPFRKWGPKAGGVILIILGLTTSLRGSGVFHHLLGCPPPPELQQQHSQAAMKPCCIGK